ncbi:MAG: DNA repair protein RadC [Planctomycetota bacterium]
MEESFKIRDLPASARPRERLQELGAGKLSDIELLAVIIGKGVKGEPVLRVAEQLLNKFKDLRAIANASVEELSKLKGIGLAKATQIKAGLELGIRVSKQSALRMEKPIIKKPSDVQALLQGELRDKEKECFVLVMLDTRSRLIKYKEISAGSLDASIVHPREVFKEAISASAASVILAHNHPSGNPEPSDDDIRLTKRLIEAGKIIDINVLDHIIIGAGEPFSMKGNKLI